MMLHLAWVENLFRIPTLLFYHQPLLGWSRRFHPSLSLDRWKEFTRDQMASATGIPQEHPQTIIGREDEPLLGSPGDVVQDDQQPILYNLITGASS